MDRLNSRLQLIQQLGRKPAPARPLFSTYSIISLSRPDIPNLSRRSSSARTVRRSFHYNTMSAQVPNGQPAKAQVQPCRYKTGKTLGAGSYSVVKECVHIDTGRYYAAKVINKRLMAGREHMVSYVEGHAEGSGDGRADCQWFRFETRSQC